MKLYLILTILAVIITASCSGSGTITPEPPELGGTIKFMQAVTDDDSNLYVTGAFSGIIDFDPGAGELLQSTGSEEVFYAFLMKLDKDYGLQWIRSWGGNKIVIGKNIDTDTQGSIYVSGLFYDTVDFDPGEGKEEYTSLGVHNPYILKFNSDGEFEWVRTFESYASEIESISTYHDYMPGVLIAGYFRGTMDFDYVFEVQENVERTSNGGADSFLCKIDEQGRTLWLRTWGGTDLDIANGIVANDLGGNVFVTGYFRDTVDFDPGIEVEEYSAIGHDDCYLSNFDLDGNLIWTKSWGGSLNDNTADIAMDNSGDVYISGDFTTFVNPVDFDPGEGVDNHYSKNSDVFLSKFDLNGNFQWVRVWGGSYSDEANGLVSENGNIYYMGLFEEIVDFDPGPGIEEHTSEGSSFNSFLSKFDPAGNFQWVKTWWNEDPDVFVYRGNLVFFGQSSGELTIE